MYVVVTISTCCGDNTYPEDDNKDQEREGKNGKKARCTLRMQGYDLTR